MVLENGKYTFVSFQWDQYLDGVVTLRETVHEMHGKN
jgi:hypothetical protein